MPGIVGFCLNNIHKETGIKTLNKMLECITHIEFYQQDPNFNNDLVYGGRSHNNTIQKNKQPFSKNRIHIWLDGEFYNRGEFIKSPGETFTSDVELLHNQYQSDQDFTFLRRIDGGFAAVICDEAKKKIHLISDRYGRQHLYWTQYRDGFAWTSELKVFSHLPYFDVIIDPVAVEDFLSIGYLLGDRTWFKNVHLLPAASVLTYDIVSKNVGSRRYWWWDELNPLPGNASREELASETAYLLTNAVEKQYRMAGENVGIALSGGRDSRAVLATIPDDGKTVNAVTFGQLKSKDIQIAARAIKVKKGNHYVHILNSSNWLDQRLKSIWWTDGQSSLIHLNSEVDKNKDRKLFDNCFVGLGGEALAGKDRQFEMENLNEDLKKKFNKNPVSEIFLNRLKNEIEKSNSAEVFYLENRFRKFSAIGLKRGESSGVRPRVPFLDNRLMEFIHSIPHTLKRRAELYDLMLIMYFPEIFKDIRWKHLNQTVSFSHKVSYFWLKSNNKFNNHLSKYGIVSSISSQFTDYPEWIRAEPARGFIESVLIDSGAIYPEFIDRTTVLNCLNQHMEGVDNHILLCRYLTFEIWMQQLFNQKYLQESNYQLTN